MKIRLFKLTSLLVLGFLANCSNNDSVEISDQEFFTFSQNASIEKETIIAELVNYEHYQVVEGNNLVFSYQQNEIDDSEIIDDETSHIIRFEIPSDVDNFTFSNEELVQLNAYYDEISIAFIPTIGINTGTISGTKIGDSNWNIAIDVTISSDFLNSDKSFVTNEQFSL